jgi:hypothetical protein
MSKDKHNLATKTYGNLLSEGFTLFGRTYIKILIPIAIFNFIAVLLSIILLAPLQENLYNYYLTHQVLFDRITQCTAGQPCPTTASEDLIINTFNFQASIYNFTQILLYGAFAAIASCAVSLYLYTTYTKGKSKLIDDLKISLSNKNILFAFFIGFCLSLLYGLTRFLGAYADFMTILLLFPFCYFIFIVYTYNVKDVDRPIQEARLIARGQTLRILGAFVLSSIITEIVSYIYLFFIRAFWNIDFLTRLSWSASLFNNFGIILFDKFLFYLLATLFSPLFICLLTPIFASAKAKKEIGFRLQKEQFVSWEKRIEQPRPRVQSSGKKPAKRPQAKWKTAASISKPSAPKGRKGGIYCPHCGILIKTAKKYCPKCGGQVDLDI